MLNTPEFKVGALVVIVSGLIGTMSMKVNEGPGLFSNARSYHFDVEDAGGLVENSAVKAAGIKVGVIEDIELVNDKARVHLLIDGDLVMRTSGKVELRSDGILGDRHVELIPGNPADPELADGSQITDASAKGSMQNLMKQMGTVADSLGAVAETLKKATHEGDESTSLGRIVGNIEKLTKDLSDISGQNKAKINDIVDNVHSITEQLDGFINDESPEGFKAGWEKATASLHRIESMLKNVDEIASKINNGEGTIGRLVNDDETVEKINETLTGINDFVGGANTMETSVDFHSEFLAESSETKSILNVKIQPGLDRYYELGIVDDANGVDRETRTVTSGSTTSDITEKKTFKDRLKFNALFAKNFYNFTLKGGIMESSGGIGVDYYMLNRDLRFSVEAFDFEDTVLRAFVRYNVFKGIYLIGGGDRLGDSDLQSGFIGAGIFITNDDLKLFASQVAF